MANDMMKNWYEAAKERVSVRQFDGKVPKDEFYELKDLTASLCNETARIDFRSKNGVLFKVPVFSLLGGVEGTNCFGAVIVRDSDKRMGGYIGEAFLLECVSRGLGTCWLGATYKKNMLRDLIELDRDERIIGVIAVGRCSRLPEHTQKKSVEQLTGLEREELNALPAWQQEAVRMAKLAPSARNRQPWELEIEGDHIHIFSNSSNFGYGDVDCGIAMLHIELGAARHGVYGDWHFDPDSADICFVPFENDGAGEKDPESDAAPEQKPSSSTGRNGMEQ